METVGVEGGSRWRRNSVRAIATGDVQLAQVFVQLLTVAGVVLHFTARSAASVQLFQLLLLLALREAVAFRCVDLDVAGVFVADERYALRGHVVDRGRKWHRPVVPEAVVMATRLGAR